MTNQGHSYSLCLLLFSSFWLSYLFHCRFQLSSRCTRLFIKDRCFLSVIYINCCCSFLSGKFVLHFSLIFSTLITIRTCNTVFSIKKLYPRSPIVTDSLLIGTRVSFLSAVTCSPGQIVPFVLITSTGRPRLPLHLSAYARNCPFSLDHCRLDALPTASQQSRSPCVSSTRSSPLSLPLFLSAGKVDLGSERS